MRRHLAPGQTGFAAQGFQLEVIPADKHLDVAAAVCAPGFRRNLRTMNHEDCLGLSNREPSRIAVPPHLAPRMAPLKGKVPGLQEPML